MKYFSLYLMAALYVLAGINHFINQGMYMAIMPPYLGWHMQLVFISGIAELVLGLLLLPSYTRVFAAWGIIALLIAVFPANIQMLVAIKKAGSNILWLAIARLPIQLLLIWWAYTFTKR